MKKSRKVLIALGLTAVFNGALATWAVFSFCSGAAAGDSCASTNQCRAGLRCLDPFTGGPSYGAQRICLDPLKRTRQTLPHRRDLRCQLEEFGCRWQGLCSWRNGKCIAASDADCMNAAVCQKEGRCRAVDGQCVN